MHILMAIIRDGTRIVLDREIKKVYVIVMKNTVIIQKEAEIEVLKRQIKELSEKSL